MTPADPSELTVRAAALYLPIALVVGLALHARPDRRRWAAVLLATVWNLVGLLALNEVAVRRGWWAFGVDTAAVGGVPADLWVGWALLWGAVPALVPARFRRVVPAALVAADLVLMPLMEPVVVLGPRWLVGEVVAVATCLLPGTLLARWTAEDRRLAARVGLQMAAFTGVVFFVLPTLILDQTGGDWSALLARPRWQFVLAGLVAASPAAMAVQGVLEFARHGGTPLPLDPPPVLVETGPYAYVANPMQAGATVLLAVWGVLLGSLAVIAAAPMAAVFSAGLAAWSEDRDLDERFGSAWVAYRHRVRVWVPRWHPTGRPMATAYVAAACEPCSEVGTFLRNRQPIALAVVPAETCSRALIRVTYEDDRGPASGIAAIGRSLEHVSLPWATASWIARLPLLEAVLQLITDAVGGGPRSLAPDTAAHLAPHAEPRPGGSSWPAS